MVSPVWYLLLWYGTYCYGFTCRLLVSVGKDAWRSSPHSHAVQANMTTGSQTSPRTCTTTGTIRWLRLGWRRPTTNWTINERRFELSFRHPIYSSFFFNLKNKSLSRFSFQILERGASARAIGALFRGLNGSALPIPLEESRALSKGTEMSLFWKNTRRRAAERELFSAFVSL